MRILFYSDRHVHDRGTGVFSRGVRLLDVHRLSAGWVCDRIKELCPDIVVDGGDSYERMGTLDVDVLQVGESTLMDIMGVCDSVGSEFYYVLGNHDLHGNFHSIPLVNEIVDRIRENCVVDVGDRRLHFWHWVDSDDAVSRYGEMVMSLGEGDIVFSHNSILGYALGPKVIEKQGLDFRHTFFGNVTVCSGHYHCPAHHRYPCVSGFVDVFLPGSLMARSFKDHFGKYPRGLLVLDVPEGGGGVSVRHLGNPHTYEFMAYRGADEESLEKKILSLPGWLDRDKLQVRAYLRDGGVKDMGGDVKEGDVKENGESVSGSGGMSVEMYPEKPLDDVEIDLSVLHDYENFVDEYFRQRGPEFIERGSDLYQEYLDYGLRLVSDYSKEGFSRRDLVFKWLRIRNFFSIGEYELRFDHEELMYILGKNGTGKSTIFESIIWGLYGRTAKAVSADAVVKNGSRGGACVEICLRVDGEDVIISRYRKDSRYRNGVRVLEGGELLNRNMSVRDSQGEIDKLLGIDYDIFTSLISLSQRATDFFTSATQGRRVELLNRVLGVDVYGGVRELVKSDMKILDRELNELSGKERVLDGKLVLARDLVEDLKRRRMDELSRIDKNIGEVKGRVSHYEGELSQLRAGKDSTYQDILDRKEMLVSERERLIVCKKEAWEGIRDNERHEGILSEELKGVECEKKYVEEKLLPEYREKIELNERELKVAEDCLREKHVSLRVHESDLERLGELSARCPVCLQEVDEAHRMSEMSRIEALADCLRAECVSYEGSDVKKWRDSLVVLRDKEREHKDILESKLRCEIILKGKRSEVVSNVVELHKNLGQYDVSLGENEREMKRIDDAEKELDIRVGSVQGFLDLERKTLKSLESRRVVVSEGSEDAGALEKVEVLEADIENVRREIADKEKDLEMNRYWEKSFSPSGVQALALKKACELLEGQACHYSGVYFGSYPPVSIVYDDGLKVRSDDVEYANLSTGERVRFNLCVQFALYDLLVEVIGRFNVLFVDEMDSGLDVEGVEQLIDLLGSLSRKVFLISHSEHVRASAPVGHKIDMNLLK